MLGLTRARVPGHVAALYLTLSLSTLLYAVNAPFTRTDILWGLVLVTLTFPWSFIVLFIVKLTAPPWWDGFSPLLALWLYLVFTTANAFILHRVSRHICGED